jgi:Rps23 Pro-64 3,4-dihydroxylase Tpa1-like proline 4-hydroxylase
MSIIHELTHPFPHLIIENIYNDVELKLIWEELEFLNKPKKFHEPEKYGASYSISHENVIKYNTNSKALDLDYIYSDRNISNILRINVKTFNYAQIYSNLSPYNLKFLQANFSITKIRYYENGDYYLPHSDCKYDTLACTYFYKQPKKFAGGELFFPQFDNYQLSCKNNSCVIFPSYFMHGVKEVHIENIDYNSGCSRYCMSQFTNVV